MLKKSINLKLILDLDNFEKSLNKWVHLQTLLHQDHHTTQQYFDRYLPVLKPILHKYSQVLRLCSPAAYSFHTSLEPNQISLLKKVFQSLAAYEILSLQALENLQLQTADISVQQIAPCLPPIFKLNLSNPPYNQQYCHWKHTLAVEPIRVESVVVHGKGKGAKQLGMPTANLDLTSAQTLIQYPSGIYLVDFVFLDLSLAFKGVACVGTNPQYENLLDSRVVEVYVLHDFGQEKFYGARVSVQLLRLIRFEGKFDSFDAFLNAMHNDIYVSKSLIASE